MSEWSSLNIDGYELGMAQNHADPDALSLFQESDKLLRLGVRVDGRYHRGPWMSRAEIDGVLGRDQGAVQWVYLQSLEEWTFDEDQDIDDVLTVENAFDPREVASIRAIIEDPAATGEHQNEDTLSHGGIVGRIDTRSPVDGHCYATTAKRARERLDAMGFTLARASDVLARTTAQSKLVLDESIERLRAQINDLEAESSDPMNLAEYLPNMRTMLARASAQRNAVDTLEMDSWLEAFRWIKAHGAQALDTTPNGRDLSWGRYYVREDQVTPLIAYLLEGERDHRLGFSHDEDIHYLWRAALEACAPDADVVLELSSLTSSGHILAEETLVQNAHVARQARTPSDAPTVVLTEGPSDRRAIEGAMELLAPHLTDLYTFMDFESMRVEGGTGPLVGMVKAFAGAGIVNRVIAIFDNDTAARSALRGLQQIILPSNIRVVRYPDLGLAEHYPTQGPNGDQIMNVNGLAASIEMYFGVDVLRNPTTGYLTPVRWSSLDQRTLQYQGALIAKDTLQQRFITKLRDARQDPGAMIAQDWSGMQAIIDVIRQAFLVIP